MTGKLSQPDTKADDEIQLCLDEPSCSFVMVAGAGSGKTTSLVKALDYARRCFGRKLRRKGQKIACITYTEIAAGEIQNEVDNSPLFHVSTIHSFLWTIIQPFQGELRTWVMVRIDEELAKARAKRSKARKKEKYERRIERYARQRQLVTDIDRFTYGTGSDYGKGILGHSDILKAGPDLVEQYPLLRSLVAQQFPYVFVDESQDTAPTVVDALRRIDESVDGTFCLGFFGDPMQQIYDTGAGEIKPTAGWRKITKQENFRSSPRVLDVVNKIRAEDDGLIQTQGRKEKRRIEGTAKAFLLPIPDSDGQRTEYLGQVRRWLASKTDDPIWKSNEDSAAIRMLVLVHRSAAKRLGFPNLYSALNDGAPEALKQGLREGGGWVLAPFLNYVLPLVEAVKRGQDFAVISALRRSCPAMSAQTLANQNIPTLLDRLSEDVKRLAQMFESDSDSTIRDVVTLIDGRELASIEDRLKAYFEMNVKVGTDDLDKEASAILSFLDCRAHELSAYRDYIEDRSPFATQHGVKGAEFERVLVVLDDAESKYYKYSYDNYLDIKDGKNSISERTRRLFYVCCTRAKRDLAVVHFVPDVAVAKEALIQRGIFPTEDIHELSEL